MPRQNKSQFDKLVMNNRLANNYAKDFDRYRIRLDDLNREASQNMLLGKRPPKALFNVLTNAARSLSLALEGLEGAETLAIVSRPAAGLCGAIQRVAQTLGGITPNAGPAG